MFIVLLTILLSTQTTSLNKQLASYKKILKLRFIKKMITINDQLSLSGLTCGQRDI